MEIIITVFFISLTVFGIELQYILGSLRTPSGMLYLGTVHWPSDYFYYLSQFIQGKTHWLSSTILYTSEKLSPVFIGWQAVLSGKILMFVGLNVIQSYQVAVGIYLTVFVFISYLVIREIFPADRYKRIIALFFFISSTSLFNIIHTPGGGTDFSYVTFWYNLGISLARFGPTPHHLIAYSLGAAGFLFTARWFKKKKHSLIDIIIFGIVGLLLASISPVHWGLLVLTAGMMGVMTILFRFRTRVLSRVSLSVSAPPTEVGVRAAGSPSTRATRSLFTAEFSLLFSFLQPVFIIFVSGLPAALYAKYVFSIPPYSYSQAWEASQQISLTFLDLVRGSGLIIVFGAIGIYPFVKKLSPARLFAVIFLLLCLFFYMTGIPSLLHLTNVRFWPSTVYIVWAVLSAEGVFWLGDVIKRVLSRVSLSVSAPEPGSVRAAGSPSTRATRFSLDNASRHPFLTSFLLLIYIASLIPSYIPLYRDVLDSHVNDLYYYIPKETYTVFKEAEKVSKPDSIFLAAWPFDEIFPALTGRKSLFGYYLLTIDYDAKQRDGFGLIDGKVTADEARKIVSKYKISYIMVYPTNKFIPALPFVKKIYGNNSLSLYRVNPESL
jgi:hypothetical protein